MYQTHELLQLAAYYSQKSYTLPESDGFHNKWLDSTAFLFEIDNYQIIAFRGSNSWRDFLLNLSAIPVPWHGAFVHLGFRIYHRAVWKRIKRHINPYKPLLITGHSLGGAAAELTAYIMRDHPDCSMVTFGKPNVFLKLGSPHFTLSGYKVSVVHGSDIVTRIPRFAFGPSRGQHMLYFGNDGKDRWNPTKAERLKDWDITDLVSDHMMGDYCERLRNYLANYKEGVK